MHDASASTFDELIAAAVRQEFRGWDFSFIEGRWREGATAWDYRDLVVRRLAAATALLDMGTGGGEFLSSLGSLPSDTCATEGYPPNLSLSRRRLEPLGVRVVPPLADGRLPFESARFDLVVNRHEAYVAAEVARVLRPGGRFLTQQVGARDNARLNQLLDAETARRFDHWTLDFAVAEVEAAGFRVAGAREDFPETTVTDIGAVVYYLKAVPWQIDGFSVDAYREPLRRLHELIETDGELVLTSHRFVIEAEKR